jgi:nicotinamide mononucleotide (NMN) deamidase PncC
MSSFNDSSLISDDIHHLAERLGERLRERGWSCATAESCTGGGIALGITSIAGSSDYMRGGVQVARPLASRSGSSTSPYRHPIRSRFRNSG